MKIDVVDTPNIKGMLTGQALDILSNYCHDIAVQIVKMSDEISELKQKIHRLENQ